MVTNPRRVEELERSFQRSEDLPLERKLALLESMYNLAREFGQFTPDRALEGIEHIVQLAASLRALARTTSR